MGGVDVGFFEKRLCGVWAIFVCTLLSGAQPPRPRRYCGGCLAPPKYGHSIAANSLTNSTDKVKAVGGPLSFLLGASQSSS